MSYPAQELHLTISVLKYKLLLAAQLDSRLTRADCSCLAYLVERFNHKHACAFPSYVGMSRDLGLGERQPKYSVAQLVRLGYVEKVRYGGRGKSNHYRPCFHSVEHWTPGWCGEETETVHSSAPKTVHETAPKTVHSSAPEPSPGNHVQRTTHTPAQPSEVCSPPNSTGRDTGKERDKPAPEELTPEELAEFIDLSTQKYARDPIRYRSSLKAQLKRGELSYSREQLQELRGETQAAQDPQQSQGQAQESEQDMQRREEVSAAIDRELDRGTEGKALLWQVFRGEVLAQERDLAESEMAKRIPEAYEAEKAKYSLLKSARTAMHYPGQAQKRVPRIIERLEAKDSHLAGQLREEWAAWRAELGLEPKGQDTGAAVEAQ